MEEKCVHELIKGTTLIQTKKRYLVHPEIMDYFCPICKRCFRFKRNSDGQTLSLVKE